MTDAVRVRACACPGTPHEDGDEVYLRPTLDLAGGLAAESALLEAARKYPLAEGSSEAEQIRVAELRTSLLRPAWFDIFLRHGAVGWNLVGPDGSPIPFDVDDLIADYSLARQAAEEANDRYSPSVLAPFQLPPAKRSRNGRTAGGTRRRSTQIPTLSEPLSPVASADGRN